MNGIELLKHYFPNGKKRSTTTTTNNNNNTNHTTNNTNKTTNNTNTTTTNTTWRKCWTEYEIRGMEKVGFTYVRTYFNLN